MKIYYQFKEENAQFIGANDRNFSEDNSHAYAGMSDSTSISTNYNYERLINKPQINSVELVGNVSFPELGLRAIYYDTTINWNRQPDLITEEGALYIYSDYSSYDDGLGNITPIANIKIGDGRSLLTNMHFINDNLAIDLLNHISNLSIHVTHEDRTFWNNKVSAYMDSESEETLVLSNM